MTRPPTIAQLRNLTDRAATGLSNDEQQRLRDGIARLAAAEQRAARLADLHARWIKAGAPPLGTSINRWWDRRLAELGAALDGRRPAGASRHVHVTIRNPDEYTANRAALSLVDWINAEFPGHHVTTDAREWAEPIVTVHAAPNLSPEAAEALDALVGVAKRQIAEDAAAVPDGTDTTEPASLRDQIAGAIREFPFDDYGMDDVSYALEGDPEAQEWVPALATAVLTALGQRPDEADRAPSSTDRRALQEQVTGAMYRVLAPGRYLLAPEEIRLVGELAPAVLAVIEQTLTAQGEARGQVARVREAIAERRAEVADYEAENEPSAWSDAVTVTCSRIEDALRAFPDPVGIRVEDSHNAGPTVAECAADDRRWPLQKTGE